MVSGILNREWVVFPLGSNNDAIPKDVTTRIIFPIDLIPTIKVFQRKVFLVPPCQYMKNILPLLSSTNSRMDW